MLRGLAQPMLQKGAAYWSCRIACSIWAGLNGMMMVLMKEDGTWAMSF